MCVRLFPVIRYVTLAWHVSFMWHDSWFIHTWDAIDSFVYIYFTHMCHICILHICIIIIHICKIHTYNHDVMIHSHLRCDWFVCGTWLIHININICKYKHTCICRLLNPEGELTPANFEVLMLNQVRGKCVFAFHTVLNMKYTLTMDLGHGNVCPQVGMCALHAGLFAVCVC